MRPIRLVSACVLAYLLAAHPCHAVDEPPCETFELHFGTVSKGWNGFAHEQALPSGQLLSLAVANRCAGAGALCNSDGDCATGETCKSTCDTTGTTPGDDECELVSAATSRCTRSLDACSTNADCEPTESCEQFPGPPIPATTAGVPTCMTMHLRDDLSGTIDLGSGESELSFSSRWRLHLGVQLEVPCPRCGAPDDDPQVGDEFLCEFGPASGQACTVEATNEVFGGVSSDCPPDPAANISGPGLLFGRTRATTGSTARQATLPCAFPLGNVHPSGDGAVCLDDYSPCSSNADCARCTNDLSACANNGDCTSGGACASAPDQPVSCGVYCHCGLCDDDPEKPCFGDADCASGETCAPGSGREVVNAPDAVPQAQGNDCTNFICGEDESERCCDGPDCAGPVPPTPPVGTCSLAPFRECSVNAECATYGAGECVLQPRPCFENVVRANGRRVPPRRVCAEPDEPTPCTTNADCAAAQCVRTCPQPTYAGATCIGPSYSQTANVVLGLPGPAVLQLRVLEDDVVPTTTTSTTSTSTTSSTSMSSTTTSRTPHPSGTTTLPSTTTTTLPPDLCGLPATEGPDPTATDCLFILSAAVQALVCEPECICDVDGNGRLGASDALLCLQVALNVEGAELRCACE